MNEIDDRKNCPTGCNRFRLETNDATGFFYMRGGMGPIIVSNVFLSASLIALAKKEIGCFSDDDEIEIECGKVYGFKPSSLITIIATITGVLGAFFLPVVGSIVDYTPHRHKTGVLISVMCVAIQGIQVFTVESTWFAMALLQAFNGFIYMLVNVCLYSYSPEIARSVGQKKFEWYSSLFFISMFVAQIVMYLVMAGVTLAVEGDLVVTGQIGQGVDVLFTGALFITGWYFLSRSGSKLKVPEGSSLLGAGFKQVFTTSKGIFKFYPKSVGLFFVATIFIDAGVAAFTTVAVTFVTEVLNFNSTQIVIIFLIVLIFTIPGCVFNGWITDKVGGSPLTSLKINLITFIAFNFAGFLMLTDPSKEYHAYVVGVFWGFEVGWLYSVEFMIYGLIVPPGNEAAFSGLFLYCTQILNWGPPLVFTVMNESDIPLKWAGISLNIWFAIGCGIMQLMLPWNECVEAAKTNKMIDGEKGVEAPKSDDFEE